MSAPTLAGKSRRFDFSRRDRNIDILRGIAILLVVVHHADAELIPGMPQLQGAAGFVLWRIKHLGWSGVDLFFVLSGFLIGGLLMNELERDGKIDIPRFCLKRAFKILPSYWVLLIVLCGLGVVQMSGRQWGLHLLFLQNYFDQGTVGPTWSLAVEEHFYLALPLLLTLLALAARSRGRSLLEGVPLLTAGVVAGCLAARLLTAGRGVTVNDFMLSHFRFDALLIGVFCQYAWRTGEARLQRLLCWWWPLVGLLLVTPALFWSRNDPRMFGFGFTCLGVGYGMLLLFAVGRGFGRFGETATARGVAHIGRWSYNIYLWHFYLVALGLPGYAALQQTIAATCSGMPVVAAALQIALLLATSVGVGYVATQVVEEPFLRLRRRLLGSRKPAVGKMAAEAA